MAKYGKTLSNQVFVKLPCGSEWEIELIKSDRFVWFQKGWPEFAKHYSIGFGHFIVFRYKGDSRFDAFILDKTTVEIDYPIVLSRCDEHNIKESEDRENSVEILEEFPTCSRKRKSSEPHCTRSPKKFKTGPIDETRLRPKGTHDQHKAEKLPYNFGTNGDSHRAKSKTKGM